MHELKLLKSIAEIIITAEPARLAIISLLERLLNDCPGYNKET